MTRRDLLERISALGAFVALAPIVAACSSVGRVRRTRRRPPPAPTAAPPTAAPSASTAVATATPEPTPVPTPESELIVYNWLDYIGEDVIPSFEEKYTVKVKYKMFDDIEVAYAKLGDDGNGYDISFPISVDVPRFARRKTLRKLDQSLLPNLVNLGPEWTNPGYDPGNQYSVPYMWWTTGVAYDTEEGQGHARPARRCSGTLADKHISMMDDYQEVFGLALIQLGYSANTTDTGPARRGPGAAPAGRSRWCGPRPTTRSRR